MNKELFDATKAIYEQKRLDAIERRKDLERFLIHKASEYDKEIKSVQDNINYFDKLLQDTIKFIDILNKSDIEKSALVTPENISNVIIPEDNITVEIPIDIPAIILKPKKSFFRKLLFWKK